MTTLPVDAAARIRAALREACMTEAELGRLMKAHPSHVNSVLRGQKTCTPKFVRRVAAALGTTPEALLATPDEPAGERVAD